MYFGYISVEVIKSADPATFEVLNSDYAKDKNNVYKSYSYKFDIVEGVDPVNCTASNLSGCVGLYEE